MLAVDLPVARRWGQLSAALVHDSGDRKGASGILPQGTSSLALKSVRQLQDFQGIA